MRANRILTGSVLMVVAFVFAASTATFTQTEKTPSQTYMEYHAALQKAKTINDVMSFMSAKRKKEGESTPAELKSGMMLEMMRDGGLQPGLQSRQGKQDGDRRDALAGRRRQRQDQAVTIVKMVREGGAWKIDDEENKTTVK